MRGVYAIGNLRLDIRVKDKGQKNEQDQCARALGQGGKIEYGGNTGSLIALAGLQASWGEWQNVESGTTGEYFTIGGGVGAGLGLTRDFGTAVSLSNFVGYGETVTAGGSISILGGSYSATQNVAGNWTSSGGSVDLLSISLLNLRRLGFTVSSTAGETFIRNCVLRGQ